MSRIAITTEEMKTLVKEVMEQCFKAHPELQVRSRNLTFDWNFGKINGRAILRILQDEYGWKGDIPLVRQPAHTEGILMRHEKVKDDYSRNVVHEGYA
jgi:hypothetical protein